MTDKNKRWCYAVWLVFIGVFAVLHALNLRADFPNHSPWVFDWAKFTDEGWYGNAAIRAHLFGHWYVAGDFNPAVALPVWPFLEWLLFFVTGVTPQAARGLAVAFFFANLLLSYLLLREHGPRWAGLLAVTLMVTSPFLYSFSRLAILEMPLTALTLAALNLAVRLPRMRRQVLVSAGIGLLLTLMLLTKTTAVFLLPAVGWALMLPLWQKRKGRGSARTTLHPRGGGVALRCAAVTLGTFGMTYGLWMANVVRLGLMGDYLYLFFINDYAKPKEIYWPLVSAMWSFHGGLWADHILMPLAGLAVLGAVATWWKLGGRDLLMDPVFGASILAAAGYIFFMTMQNHPQPRYFAVVAVFCFIVLARGAEAMVSHAPAEPFSRLHAAHLAGWAVIGLAVLAAGINSARTVGYALHPQYTFVTAAEQLTHYIDSHPNGNRLLVSISGDEISLVSHQPALCDDFDAPTDAIPDLPAKMAFYKPGWYASWNDMDPGTLEDIHTHFSLEQVATFPAFDDPERDLLVLFKLHPLPGGLVRDPGDENLKDYLPGDKVDVPVE